MLRAAEYRLQRLRHFFLAQEQHVRVFNPDFESILTDRSTPEMVQFDSIPRAFRLSIPGEREQRLGFMTQRYPRPSHKAQKLA